VIGADTESVPVTALAVKDSLIDRIAPPPLGIRIAVGGTLGPPRPGADWPLEAHVWAVVPDVPNAGPLGAVEPAPPSAPRVGSRDNHERVIRRHSG
jgi:hypothetical protein